MPYTASCDPSLASLFTFLTRICCWPYPQSCRAATRHRRFRKSSGIPLFCPTTIYRDPKCTVHHRQYPEVLTSKCSLRIYSVWRAILALLDLKRFVVSSFWKVRRKCLCDHLPVLLLFLLFCLNFPFLVYAGALTNIC